MTILTLALISTLTSLVSAITGMGGGVALISLMTFFLPYQAIVPIHGLVQLISNSSRTIILKSFVKWNFVLWFCMGIPIGYTIAYFFLSSIENVEFYYLILGVFILLAIFRPKKIPHFKIHSYQWAFLGLLAALSSSVLGATGPLIAPFYLRDDLSKEEIISTKAMQQLFVHLGKIPLFLSLGFKYEEHLLLITLMCLGALVGTSLGIRILKKINQNLFTLIFKSVLFIAAIRLILKYISNL